MNLTPLQWRTLLALGDVLVPRDEFPSASEAGLRTFVEHNAADFGAPVVERLIAGVDALTRVDFENLSAEEQRTVIARLEADDAPVQWPERSSRWLRLVELPEQMHEV